MDLAQLFFLATCQFSSCLYLVRVFFIIQICLQRSDQVNNVLDMSICRLIFAAEDAIRQI